MSHGYTLQPQVLSYKFLPDNLSLESWNSPIFFIFQFPVILRLT